MRQQANVVFGIRAESLLDLSKELSNGGVGGYLYFKDSIAILVDGESEDVGVFFDGGFAIGVEGKGWFGEWIIGFLHLFKISSQ